jgi:hypothetical protein
MGDLTDTATEDYGNVRLTGTQAERDFAMAVANTPPGMAHTIGSGPPGWTCHACLHWEHKDIDYFAPGGIHDGEIKPAICAMYRKLMAGQTGAPVEHWNRCCKYFEHNPAPPALRKR